VELKQLGNAIEKEYFSMPNVKEAIRTKELPP
jgi:hypothetical protein